MNIRAVVVSVKNLSMDHYVNVVRLLISERNFNFKYIIKISKMEQGMKIANKMESFVLEKASAIVVDVSARQSII